MFPRSRCTLTTHAVLQPLATQSQRCYHGRPGILSNTWALEKTNYVVGHLLGALGPLSQARHRGDEELLCHHLVLVYCLLIYS